MKKALFTLMLLPATLIVLFAQPRPKIGKKFPSFVQLEQPQPLTQRNNLFNAYLEMGQDDELRLERTDTDNLGFSHYRYQQYYKGVKVDGAIYTVHEKGGRILTLSGNFRSVFDLDVGAFISPDQALQYAMQHVGAGKYAWQPGGFDGFEKPQGELVIFADPEGILPARLTYKFDVYAVEPISRAYVFVDAHNGEVVREFARIHESNVPATGTSLYNGTVSFTADFTGSNYRLRQTADGGGVQTYSLNNGTNYNNATDITSGSSSFNNVDNTAVQAHWGAEQTYKYYLQNHGRNSYNNAGGVLRNYVHYSNNYVNAYWDGTRMTYGDGDGVNYGPLVSSDITGHEITHGVTEYSANLAYQRESGALNESFSDIFGEMVEYFAEGSNDWQMGTDIGIGGSGAIRSMNNPNAYGDPDTYGGSYWYNPNCGTPTQNNDYCGVHTNSGVQNKWFYILTMGESGTNDLGNSYSVSGVGRTKAAAITYRNLTTYLSSSSTYADARNGAIQAAIDLYGAGSAEEIATTNAWYAVGVGGEYGTISYCSSAGSNSSYEWISNVTVGSFSNSSGAAGYTNFTSQTVNVNAGQNYSISLTPGFSSSTYTEYWKIWIDLNADGDFTDSGEQVYASGGSNATVSGSISIPSGAAGTTTRMRVTMKYNATPTGPCETFAYGEVEDYTIAIGGGGGPDTQAPSAPTSLSASNTTQTSTDLSWNASTDNVGVTGYNIYVDGVNVDNTASTSYALGGLTASTTYAIYVTAYDAAGNESGSSNTINVTTQSSGGGGGSDVLLGSYFETGWDGWADGGSDCARYFGSRSWEGNYSIYIRDNSGVASAMTSPTLNLSGYSQLDIEFYFYAYSMENGEDFWVRYYNGSTWTTVAAYARGTSFNNNTFYVATVTLTNAGYTFPSNAQIRFQCDASANNDLVYIDAVTVTASNPSGFMAGGATRQTIQELGKVVPEGNAFLEGDSEAPATLFPNPATDELSINTTDELLGVRIFAANGALVKNLKTFEKGQTIDIEDLQPGMYFIALETAGGVINKRFIKQ
ncbi:MAG: M4 family metallopeptidase [Lewinella sp.]|nr:M4 family metallopeptidase [Lewinella sp.]